METMEPLEELLTCRLDSGRMMAGPCTIVIFGASGDLTARKLIPAFYHLHASGQLPNPCRIIGFARRTKTDEQWRGELREAMRRLSRPQSAAASAWDEFAKLLNYCQGNLEDAAAYGRLAQMIDQAGHPDLRQNLLFYLAIAPDQFGTVAEQLHAIGLLHRGEQQQGWRRLVIEKPFGEDLDSARRLNDTLAKYASERQIFRIDHYLGKETVQNIIVFRFSNSIFEPLWNRTLVDNVQITVSEKSGIGSRGGFYDKTGALRDIGQNHLLQVLSLVAMEPPVSLEAEAIRNEKVKLLKSIRHIPIEQVGRQFVRGQYVSGEIDGQPVPAYRKEERVSPDSNVETFIAMKLFIDNWRWSGVPFFLRSGKRLPVNASEVRVQFKLPPSVLFAARCGPLLDSNSITLRLQPDEGITLRFNGKIPGVGMGLRPVRMHFSYDAEFGAYTPEAYERLLLDAMAGDATLFIRSDEVEAAWNLVDPVVKAWKGKSLTEREFYQAGSWGPTAADDLLLQTGHQWRNPQPSTAQVK